MGMTGEGARSGSGRPGSVRRRGRGARRGGFTLAELALAMTVLMVALMSISAATLRAHTLRRQNRERALAQNAIRSWAERIHSVSYREAAENPAGWVQQVLQTYGPGGQVGDTFDVEGLNPVVADGQVGSLVFVTDETATDAALGVELGMPRDLNGDSDATDGDVTGDARILPVIITIQWRGVSGTSQLRHPFYIAGF